MLYKHKRLEKTLAESGVRARAALLQVNHSTSCSRSRTCTIAAC